MVAMVRQTDGRTFGIFLAFLKLGCVAFGGPVAHLGFLQEEFVRKRRWLGEVEYADLVALCQFLPGPASSQVGFAIGLKQGGIPGAFAAWLGFTLPSAVLMIAFALGLSHLDPTADTGWIAGLKVAAVAVVANAVWSMSANLCPDRQRALIALTAAALLVAIREPLMQVAAIVAGGLAGWIVYRRGPLSRGSGVAAQPPARGWPWLTAFAVLLIALPLARSVWPAGELAVVEAFYRAGSLVFGGGHVVLPLLDSYTVGRGWVDHDSFLAGYGAAQAMPGPLFTFCGFLGASLTVGPGGIMGGTLALVAVFLPSWLLVLAAIPYWDRLRTHQAAQAALAGTNAAVVGLLLAAFYDPIWTNGITSSVRLAMGLIAFALLRFAHIPPWALVVACGVGGHALL